MSEEAVTVSPGDPMRLMAPMFISSRLMAAAKVGEDGGTLHIEPVGRDTEDRVVWRYVIEDDTHTVFEGADLRSGVGDSVDPRKAMATLVGFLDAAADEYRTAMRYWSDDGELFPPEVMEWAYMHDDDLASLGLDLEEPGGQRVVEFRMAPVHAGPLPEGWIARPSDADPEVEIAYDPRKLSVVTTEPDVPDRTRRMLRDLGYEPFGPPDSSGMVVWGGDPAQLSACLDRLPAMTTGPELTDSTRQKVEESGYRPFGRPDSAGVQVWTADPARLAEARLDRLAHGTPSPPDQSVGLA